MTFVVAGAAAEFKFVDDGVAGVFICGNVTELEQRLTFAVNTDPIAFLDDPFLAIRRMALFHSSVNQAGLRIMNQNPNKRCRDQRGDNRFRDWNAIGRVPYAAHRTVCRVRCRGVRFRCRVWRW